MPIFFLIYLGVFPAPTEASPLLLSLLLSLSGFVKELEPYEEFRVIIIEVLKSKELRNPGY